MQQDKPTHDEAFNYQQCPHDLQYVAEGYSWAPAGVYQGNN